MISKAKKNLLENISSLPENLQEDLKVLFEHLDETEKNLEKVTSELEKLKKELRPLNKENLPGEIWRDVVGYEGLYQVSNFGRVKSFKQKSVKILRPSKTTRGYHRVSLWKNHKEKHCHIHTLVAQAFIPNSENKPLVNHKNGIKTDNFVENLEWVTSSENMRHAVEVGIVKTGAEHSCAKLTKEQVREIRETCVWGDKEKGICALAKKFGVSIAAIHNVLYGKSYK